MEPLLERSKVYLYYCGLNWSALSLQDRLRYAEWAFEDSDTCMELSPKWVYAYLICLESSIYISVLNNDVDSLRRGMLSVTEFLDGKWGYYKLHDKERSLAINCRAQCHHFLGNLTEAERTMANPSDWTPRSPVGTSDREQFWESRGCTTRVSADRSKAEALRLQRRRSAGN